MNNQIATQPILFHLEDNDDLAHEIKAVAEPLGYQVRRACCVEEAEAWARNHGWENVRAVLIDLMLPRTKEDYEAVKVLLARRWKQVRRVTEPKATPNARQEANDEIYAIDRRIQNLIIDAGGIRFLDWVKLHHKFPSKPPTPVAIFSALPSKDSEGALEHQVRDALGTNYAKWFEKPADPDEIEVWLQNMFTCQPGKDVSADSNTHPRFA